MGTTTLVISGNEYDEWGDDNISVFFFRRRA